MLFDPSPNPQLKAADPLDCIQDSEIERDNRERELELLDIPFEYNFQVLL
jgi:hypothetical protein